MISEKHTRNIIIIGDGYSDYMVLKRLVSILLEHDNTNEISLNFLDYHLLTSLNIGDYINDFIKKSNQKADNYDLFGENTRDLKQHIVKVLTKVLKMAQNEAIQLSHRDLVIISSDSEKPLTHRNNYFQTWAYSVEAILEVAIDEFYHQLVEQGYSHQYLPLVVPLICFPSIEILVAACTEDSLDFDNQCRSLQAKPDLKQKVWGTESIDKARRSGMLYDILDAYMTPDALDKVYQNIPEARKIIQVLSFAVK